MLQPIPKELLFSRNDPNDLRLGDLATIGTATELHDLSNAKHPPIAILGYPDDAGIKLNGGRVGASLAPRTIRQYLYKMTPPAFLGLDSKEHTRIVDLGDLDCAKIDSLGDRHETARKMAGDALNAKARLISFGGGHDYGFSDASAFCEKVISEGEKPLVINFDAHLDVRPTDRGLTSGTPFYRLLEKFNDIDFVELGLQGQCNSREHLLWAEERGALCSFEEDRNLEGASLTATLQRFLGDSAIRRRPAFLSIDIDGFSSAIAPGASQSWPTGFQAQDFFDVFSWCLSRLDVKSIGIYEVSPPLDVDDRTSRLAALIAHRFMFQL